MGASGNRMNLDTGVTAGIRHGRDGGGSRLSLRPRLGRPSRVGWAALASVANEYAADRILLPRRGDSWGVIHQVAATAARDRQVAVDPVPIVDGSGWDAFELTPGSRLTSPITPLGAVDLQRDP